MEVEFAEYESAWLDGLQFAYLVVGRLRDGRCCIPSEALAPELDNTAIDANLELGLQPLCDESILISLRVDVGFILVFLRNYLISLSAVFGEPYSQMIEQDVTNFYGKLIYDATSKIILPPAATKHPASNSGQENWLKSSPSSDDIQNTTMSALYFHQETDPDYPQLKWHWKSRDIPYKSYHITSHE